MRKNQQGFAALGAIVLLIVVAVVVGGGYYVLKNQNKDILTSTQSADSSTKKAFISANGTPENAAKAVTQQLDTEIKIEDDGADQEAKESALSTKSLNGVSEAIDVSKL